MASISKIKFLLEDLPMAALSLITLVIHFFTYSQNSVLLLILRAFADNIEIDIWCDEFLGVASYAGIKDYVPPYLDRNLSMEELLTGVSFASAGSGYDPLTPTLTVRIPWNIWHASLLSDFLVCADEHNLIFTF